MKIKCISASNTKRMGDKSASTNVCQMIKNNISAIHNGIAEVDILPLMDYDLKPCILCGDCSASGHCPYDDAFNKIFDQIVDADGLFFVIPHYSPIPSKLLILFEKINEILYAKWIHDPEYISPLNGKPVGIVGHGGMVETEAVLKYYHEQLVTPVANTLKSLSFKPIPCDDQFPNGAVFGLKDDACIYKVEGKLFPDIRQDWMSIDARIKPLIENFIKEI